MEQIYNRYQPLILRAAHQPHLATLRDDAESEAMLSLLEAVHTYDPSTGVPFAAYAKRKIFGDVRTFFRRERSRWQSEFVPYETEDGGSVWEELADPAREMEEVEVKAVLRHALSQLPLREREIIECLLSERMTTAELAERYGVVFQTISKWKQKALKRIDWLRLLLREEIEM